MPEVEAKRPDGTCAVDTEECPEREEGSSGRALRNPDVCLGRGGKNEPGLQTKREQLVRQEDTRKVQCPECEGLESS